MIKPGPRPLALLDRIRQPADTAVSAVPLGSGHWSVTICAADRLGMLSIIAGLLSAYRLDILSGDVFTVRRAHPASQPGLARGRRLTSRRSAPAPPALSHYVLDIFEVRSLEATGEVRWEAFEEELRELVGLLVAGRQDEATDRIADRVTAAFRSAAASNAQLFPVSIDVINEASSPPTQISIRSADTPGFLFAFTNALAGVTVNVERAQVRTVGGEAVDTFWVTDLSGHKIVEEDRIHELRVATVLLKQFTHLLPRSPNPGQALRQFNALVRHMVSRREWTDDLRDLHSPQVLETLAQLMGVSRFLWEDFLRMQHQNLFPVVRDVPALDLHKAKGELEAELRAALEPLSPLDRRIDALNQFKDREMFRIDLRHITGRVSFREFSHELSDLAEVVIQSAADLSNEGRREKHGVPTLPNGEPCRWCILALGKFGGSELGFGSDLELLFAYDGEGRTTGPAQLSNSEYFEEFVRGTVGALRARQEGIFQVDLRLRPYGRAGTLASPLEGLRAYYSDEGQAQQFERLALVKLRPVAGDDGLGRDAVDVRNAFVYSGKPLDRDNILHLRRRQATELVPSGQINAKYSAGGLVDVEYFVQARQIEAGHEDTSVRVPNTLEAIDRLEDGGHLPTEQAQEVRAAYIFLRQLIDALRVVRGSAKDLTIPAEGSREFAYLAQRLHLASAAELSARVERWMAFARRLWES